MKTTQDTVEDVSKAAVTATMLCNELRAAHAGCENPLMEFLLLEMIEKASALSSKLNQIEAAIV